MHWEQTVSNSSTTYSHVNQPQSRLHVLCYSVDSLTGKHAPVLSTTTHQLEFSPVPEPGVTLMPLAMNAGSGGALKLLTAIHFLMNIPINTYISCY